MELSNNYFNDSAGWQRLWRGSKRKVFAAHLLPEFETAVTLTLAQNKATCITQIAPYVLTETSTFASAIQWDHIFSVHHHHPDKISKIERLLYIFLNIKILHFVLTCLNKCFNYILYVFSSLYFESKKEISFLKQWMCINKHHWLQEHYQFYTLVSRSFSQVVYGSNICLCQEGEELHYDVPINIRGKFRHQSTWTNVFSFFQFN